MVKHRKCAMCTNFLLSADWGYSSRLTTGVDHKD